MDNASKLSKIFYAILGLLFILPIFVPLAYDNSYSSDRKLETSKQLLTLNLGSTGLQIILVTAVGLVACLLAYLIAVRIGYRKIALLLPILVAGYGMYIIDVAIRLKLIRLAYIEQRAYGNVAPVGPGYYVYVAIILFSVILMKYNHSWELNETIEHMKKWIARKVKELDSPTTVQLATLWLTGNLMMAVSYSMYFKTSNFWEGPTYYMKLFLTYGLNYEYTPPSIALNLSWLVAPFMLIPIAFILYGLKAAGYAPNGPGVAVTAPESFLVQDKYNYDIWAYFSMDAPFAENYFFNNPKLNIFYLMIFSTFFFSIILASVINFYRYGRERQPNFFALLRFFIFMGAFYSYWVAVMSAPVFITFMGIIPSVFDETRNTNKFVQYKWLFINDADNGTYHPLSTLWIFIFMIVPLLVILISINILITYTMDGKIFEKKESIQIVGKYIDESKTSLPWE